MGANNRAELVPSPRAYARNGSSLGDKIILFDIDENKLAQKFVLIMTVCFYVSNRWLCAHAAGVLLHVNSI
jgi:hypothetical protein